jgi:chromosome segregation ATPase
VAHTASNRALLDGTALYRQDDNGQIQPNSINTSLDAAKFEGEVFLQPLDEHAAELSLLEDQLSGANATNETLTQLLNVLKSRMDAQTAELQVAKEELRRSKNELNAMRNANADIVSPT